MDFPGLHDQPATQGATAGTVEQRGAQRYTSLIRSAKLVTLQGEFVCVIRDVSATGIGIRTFHQIPISPENVLQLQNGELYELLPVRANGRDASFTFPQPIDVQHLIQESWHFPKRPLRLNLELPLKLSTLSGRAEAVTENLSQQGACVTCDSLFAIDQPVRVEGKAMPEIRAKVRWRKGHRYGLVFDNTFSLPQFAQLAAQVQYPELLRDDAN